MRLLAALAGGLIILLVLADAFSTIVLARRTRHWFRITRAFYALTWKPYAAIARRIDSGRVRENVLGVCGPLSLLLILGFWEIGLIAGFGLAEWSAGIRPERDSGTLLNGLYFSATTFFTLETGRPRNVISKTVTVIDGGFGIAFLGLIISYPPVFYQAFSGREREISQLDARAGSPPCAADILQLKFSNPAAIERYLEHWGGSSQRIFSDERTSRGARLSWE